MTNLTSVMLVTDLHLYFTGFSVRANIHTWVTGSQSWHQHQCSPQNLVRKYNFISKKASGKIDKKYGELFLSNRNADDDAECICLHTNVKIFGVFKITAILLMIALAIVHFKGKRHSDNQ